MNYKHGLTPAIKPSRFYNIWKGIKRRTNNKNSIGYKTYGAKGIRCLWKTFGDFHKDMYQSYIDHVHEFGEKDTTIERNDNRGHYCKENCRWATMKEQLEHRQCINRYMINKLRTQQVTAV